MQPQQNPIPMNYLDEIAPQQKPSGMNNKLLFIIIGGVVALVVLLLMIMIASSGSGKPKTLQVLGLRLQTLQKVSAGAQKNIKDTDLRSANSTLVTYLTNANRDIEKPLEAADITLSQASKATIKKESGDELLAALEDARLNGVYDRTYAREMAYQLETVLVLMTSSKKTTKSKSLKDFVDAHHSDLVTLQKQFADYSAANS